MNKRKKSKIGLIIFIIILANFSWILINQQIKLNSQMDEMNNIQKKIDDQNKVNLELKDQKEKVNSDEYAEKVAREKLGMVKDGEKIFIDVNK